jgi:hypothetical protein
VKQSRYSKGQSDDNAALTSAMLDRQVHDAQVIQIRNE